MTPEFWPTRPDRRLLEGIKLLPVIIKVFFPPQTFVERCLSSQTTRPARPMDFNAQAAVVGVAEAQPIIADSKRLFFAEI